MQRKRKRQYERNNNALQPQHKRRNEEEEEEEQQQQQQQQQHEEQQRLEMEQALTTNVRRDEWIQHRKNERELITKISYDSQNEEVEETYTREEWRKWGNYEHEVIREGEEIPEEWF